MSDTSNLTPKQEAFVLAYLNTGNASEAYRQAYACANMAAATINREASALLENPKITTRLTQLRDEVANKAVLNRSWVLTRLMKSAQVSLGEQNIKLRVQRKDKETGNVEVSEIEVSAYDAKAANQALIALGRTDEVRAFVDRVEATGKDGEELFPEETPLTKLEMARQIAYALREGAKAARELNAGIATDEPGKSEG